MNASIPAVIHRYPRIVFMGTPEFAVASLEALVNAGYHIVGVITAADKPAGRGMKLTESPVKKYAAAHELFLLTPEKLKNPAFIEALASLKADLQVVVAFRMLPEIVWNMPPLGTINLHGSLLPQYRGAAPINWAVIQGEKKTGVTTFKLKHEIDTGNIMLQRSFEIGENDTAGDVHDRMMRIGAELLVDTVRGMMDGTIQEIPQPVIDSESKEVKEIKQAPKIFTEDCRINWQKSIAEIHNFVRGLSPYPGAFTELNGKMLKIYKAEKRHSMTAVDPGKMETDQKTFLRFYGNDGFLELKELQLEGKKKMTAEEFLRGFRF